MAASIKCDERPFRGGVWGGFALPGKNPCRQRASGRTFGRLNAGGQLSGQSSAAPVSSAGVRPGVRPDVRPDVRAARVSSAAPKKKSFDRGGPVWPPRSNVTNDRLRGGLGGLCPPSQKPGGLGGSAPQPKIFRKISKKNPRDLYFTNALFYYDSPLLGDVTVCNL